MRSAAGRTATPTRSRACSRGCPGPRKGLIGPWAHAWPQAGPPEPTIGFLQEVIRWFDHWLVGTETGIMDEPMLRAWIHEPVRPAACYTERPGRWVAEDGWPRADVPARTLVLGGDGRLDEAGEDGRLQIVGQQTAGLDAGSWCPYGEVADWPGDQRAMDGMSLTFTSDPLPERLEILGYPEVTLRLESDRPLALVIVRLCEVWPDGASTVVTRALQNLTHRESDEHPAALVPGEPFTATIRLDATGHAFAPGNRIRVGRLADLLAVGVAVAGAGDSGAATPARARSRCPSASRGPRTARCPSSASPRSPSRCPRRCSGPAPPGGRSRTTSRRAGSSSSYDWQVGGLIRLPNGLEIEDRNLTVFSIVEGDPLSARVRCRDGRGDRPRRLAHAVRDGLGDDLRRGLVPRQEHGPGLGGRQARLRADVQAQLPRDLV